MAEGKQVIRNLVIPACYCDFFLRYCLPCKHMFAQDDFVGLHTYLTDTVWATFTNGWEEQGYDIYWRKESFYLDRPDLPELQLPSRFEMQIKRATDLFYSLRGAGNY